MIEPCYDGFATAAEEAVRQRPADWTRVLRLLTSQHSEPGARNALRQCAERFLAAVALLVTLPVMVLVALAIRIDSPGPVLFRQLRVGRGGHLFWFLKFRTFWADARQRYPDLFAYNYTPGEIEQLYFKTPNDPRVTRIGEWLRTTTLDELPNLWNVLAGDMALVGPRPEIPEMLPYYGDEQLIKFSVPPGITGLAQISGRGRLRFLETAALDAEYVRNRGFQLDMRILARTIWLIARRDGAF